MKKRWSTLVLTASLFSLTGCIAGGGEPYDDSESVYEPTIDVEQTIVDDDRYTLIVEEIIRKSHEDVGNMVEVQFHYTNKTNETLFLTSNEITFDDVQVNVGVMAFFEELAPNSDGIVTAYFQDIEDKGYIVPP